MQPSNGTWVKIGAWTLGANRADCMVVFKVDSYKLTSLSNIARITVLRRPKCRQPAAIWTSFLPFRALSRLMKKNE